MYQPEHSAKIAEWNAEKGFGWLQFGDRRLFLHRRELEGSRSAPNVGEVIRFTLGQDSQGRPCATNAVSSRYRIGISTLSVFVLAGLLVLPAVALRRLPFDAWQTAACAFVISAITYGAYASDKQRARTKAWRIAESSLHLLELLGGWPGAWLAQARLRHKCSKRSYQFIFWLIILIHQFAAYDFLHGWRSSHELIRRVTETGARGSYGR
jgi:uncharacterized membrane protein YsdA (DUF1294 family)/cold shock CspA family protein